MSSQEGFSTYSNPTLFLKKAFDRLTITVKYLKDLVVGNAHPTTTTQRFGGGRCPPYNYPLSTINYQLEEASNLANLLCNS